MAAWGHFRRSQQFGPRANSRPVSLRKQACSPGDGKILLWASKRLMRCNKTAPGSITKPATCPFPCDRPRDRLPRSAREITDAAARVHRRAWERGGVADGGAGAGAAGDPGYRIPSAPNPLIVGPCQNAVRSPPMRRSMGRCLTSPCGFSRPWAFPPLLRLPPGGRETATYTRTLTPAGELR